jgi:hypothetical protein
VSCAVAQAEPVVAEGDVPGRAELLAAGDDVVEVNGVVAVDGVVVVGAGAVDAGPALEPVVGCEDPEHPARPRTTANSGRATTRGSFTRSR